MAYTTLNKMVTVFINNRSIMDIAAGQGKVVVQFLRL